MVSFDGPVNLSEDFASTTASDAARRGNRRRLRVFTAAFAATLFAGLAYTFARPAEYRAQGTIAVKFAAMVTELPPAVMKSATITSTTENANANSLHAEAGRLTSRPLIEAALVALRAQGLDMPEYGADPVQSIQAALAAETVVDSGLITLTSIGRKPEHLAAIVNAVIAAYADEMVSNYTRSTTAEVDALRQELENLNQRVAQRRAALERFRQAADIVSGERDENQILARVKGLSASLNLAAEKVAQAEGRVRALRESLASGKSAVRGRDNPGLATLEAQASELRASLREQERTFTPQFMAMDQNVRAMRSRLEDIEAQIAEQKASAGTVALTEAEDDLTTARQSQRKLQAQIAEERNAVHAFSRNFGMFEAMQAELNQIEASRSSLSERLLRTETSQRSRKPSVQVVESAIAPREIWQPNYGRDAGISIAVAFAMGLLTMGLVELFNRPPRSSPAPMILPQSWIAMGQAFPPSLATGPALRHLPDSANAAVQLPGALEMPRELSQAELVGLLQTLRASDAVWAGLLLCGATQAEIRRIAAADLDSTSASVRLQGSCARTLSVPPQLFRTLEAAAAKGNRPSNAVIAMPDSDQELNRLLLCAAHDAGLENAASVTPQALRHTCIAYLVRQGLRFGDLDLIAGPLPADELASYAGLAPAGVRRTIRDVTLVMPALESLREAWPPESATTSTQGRETI